MGEDFSQGKIYKIISDHCELPYIGSTTRELSLRLKEHSNEFFRFIDGSKKDYSSYELIKLGSVRIELIENFPCNSKKELELQERKYINPGVNCVIFMLLLSTGQLLFPVHQSR